MLPDFIIIGSMKSGTTTLYRNLSAHPDVDMSREKETDFFVAEKNWRLGLDWYSGQFLPQGTRKRGEASPNYTKSRDFPGVPERIAQHCPDARLIYIVRDPVVRAESQFRHSFLLGALDDLDMATFEGSHGYHHIVDASRYAHQIDAYLEHFSKEALLILDFDRLVQSPQMVMDQVTAHIGIAPHPIDGLGLHNDSAQLSRVPAPILRFAHSSTGRALADLVSRETRDKIRGFLAKGKARKTPPFSDGLRASIRRDLSADTDRFRKITGQDFAHWQV